MPLQVARKDRYRSPVKLSTLKQPIQEQRLMYMATALNDRYGCLHFPLSADFVVTWLR